MFEWFKRKPQQEKESRTGSIIYREGLNAKWQMAGDKTGAADYAKEGYQKNVVAFQAINKRANAVAALPWVVKRRNGEELTEHPLLKLLENPNPLQSGSEFMRAAVGFFSISGNCYLERVMAGKQPRELYALRPDRMRVIPSSTGFPGGYVYSVGQNSLKFEADPRTGDSDIRHLKTFNPLDDWYGMSPLMAGAFAVDQHNEGMSWIQALLQNSAAPSGILEYTGDSEMTDDQYARLKADVEEKYSGSRNAGRPLIGDSIKWTQMGLSPVDMTIIETKYSSARDISLALEVPPLLLNIPGDSTYSNYKEARLAFYEETVIPLGEFFADEINAWLSPFFPDVELDFDKDQIPAIAEKRMDLWAMADRATDLTINERRAIKGYEEIPDGDQILVNAGLVPLSFAASDIDIDDNELDDTELVKSIVYGGKK